MIEPVLEIESVTRRDSGTKLLQSVNWRIETNQNWIILGPNGSGKTTLLRIAALTLHPSEGEITVFGEKLGHADVRSLRSKIGYSSAALASFLQPTLTAGEVVVTGLHASLASWWHNYSSTDFHRAHELLERVSCENHIDQKFKTLSSGEQQRVLLARALMPKPGILLLYEPNAALDLVGREELIMVLEELATDPKVPPIVLVTHHVEEIPSSFSHALLLSNGQVVASGEIGNVLTKSNMSLCFGSNIEVQRSKGRWSARIDETGIRHD